MKNSEKAPNVLESVEDDPGAYPGGSGGKDAKNEKMLDPSSQAEKRGEGKILVQKKGTPSPVGNCLRGQP